MKKRIIVSLLGLVTSAATSYGNGYIYFENYNTTDFGFHYAATNVPAGKAGVGLNSGFTASLYWSIGNVAEPTINDPTAVPIALQLLPDQGGPSQTNYPTVLLDDFFGEPGIFGYRSNGFVFNPPVILPGYTSGPVTFEIVVWGNSGPYGGSTYATSGLRGHTTAFIMSSLSTNFATPSFLPYLLPTNCPFVQIACMGIPPQINQQPTNQTVASGATVTFSVTAVSDFPVSYQWLFNGTNISGATGSSLVLNAVQSTNGGLYSVAISGCNSLVISSNATLTVLTKPTIVSQPQGTVGYWGLNAHFEVGADGVPPPGYLWYKDGFPIFWATDYSLDLTNLALTDGGNYWVVVGNSQGSATSSPALLVVNPAGVTIGLHPYLQIVGAVGKTFGIQYTTNVSQSNSWITLTNFNLTQSTQEWIDTAVNTASGQDPKRFYRIIAVP